MTGDELSENKREALYAETEGNPFFIVETLRSGEQGVPQSLLSVLNRRLNQLSASARELVGWAAAIGREFGYSLLARASQMEEMLLVQALDELWSRRIIQTRQDGTYHFTHGKLLDAAYDTLTDPRRRLLHRKIAEAFLQREMDVENAIVARHFEMAGEHRQAFEYYLRAADDARRIFANHDAISHLEKALHLSTPQAENKIAALKARELLGDLCYLGSDGRRALDVYTEAFDHAPASDHSTRGRVLGKIARVTAYAGDYEKGISQFNQANELLGEPPDESDREWWHTWLKMQFDRVWIHYDAGDVTGTQTALEAIRPVVERMGELDQLGEYYFLMPTIYFRRDGYQMNEEIMRYSTLALEIGGQSENLELRTRTNFGYGFCNFLLGKFDLAIQYLGEGAKLAEQIGYVEQQIYGLTYLAAAHRCAGNLDECKAVTERALLISEREGERSFTATAYANLGWLAWKQNDLRRAKTLSLKALDGWGKYYPFQWYGLWTLMDISLSALQFDEAIEYARRLKAPGQQVFPNEVDALLATAIHFAEQGDVAKSKSQLRQAVDWAKENHFL